jgi:DnaJ-domain-containing protein 1
METSNLKDYYKILGVPKTAASEEIKKAFRMKARLYHPDVCKLPNAHQIFIQIGEAYETLIDPASRKQYDYLWDEYNRQRTRQAEQSPPRSSGNGTHQQHTASRQAYDDFSQKRNQANARAQTYANMSMDDFMSSVFGRAYEAGKAAVFHILYGDKRIHTRTFFDYFYLGIKAIMLMCFVFSPVLFVGIFIFPSFLSRCWIWALYENDGQYIGLFPLLKGLLTVYLISCAIGFIITYL